MLDGSIHEQVQHVRLALGDLAVEVDLQHFPPDLRPSEDLPATEIVRQSMPKLTPPLSATIQCRPRRPDLTGRLACEGNPSAFPDPGTSLSRGPCR